jgi:hypothetical protein
LNRKLLIGAVFLTKKEIKQCGKILISVCDEFESYVANANYPKNFGFDRIKMIIEFSDLEDSDPIYGPIDEPNLDLHVTLNMNIGALVDQSDEVIREKLKAATHNVIAKLHASLDIDFKPR